MGFLDKLAENPRGSGIYGNPGPQQPDSSAAMNLISQLRDREMNDFKERANFQAELPIRQERMRSLFSGVPIGMDGAQRGNVMPGQQMDTVFHDSAPPITPFQQAGLGIDRQKLGLDQQRLQQTGKLGEERLGIAQQGADLNANKSQQIFETKQADMQRKIEESNAKLELAQKALEQKGSNAESQLAAHKAVQEAMEERHKLEIAHKDMQFDETKRMHDAAIADMQKKADLAAKPTTQTTELDASGNKKTVTTAKGSNRVQVIHPDGTPGTIDASESDKAVKAGWKVVK